MASPPDPGARPALYGAALAALEAELDWPLLGRSLCEGDGSSFFDAARRERWLDTGLWFADDLARSLPAGPAGHGVWLGAATAELPALLCESLVLERRVSWVNLESAETRELARALQQVARALDLDLPGPRFEGLQAVPKRSADHVWMASVLTDPECFPALHDSLYERAGSPHATGRGDLREEELRAETLVRDLFARARDVARLSTSAEELRWIGARAAQLGVRLAVQPGARVSAVVGDPIHAARLERTAR